MDDVLEINPLSKDLMQKYSIGDYAVTTSSTPISYASYLSWVSNNKAGSLIYMRDDRATLRSSLNNIFPDFQSALVFLFTYKKRPEGTNGLKIADYVWGFEGKDYHLVLSRHLDEIIQQQIPYADLKYKIVIDTAPVLERDLAYRSGLGWFGKNSMLINKSLGSYFIIASVLFNKKIIINSDKKIDGLPNVLESDHCGSCTRCVVACPTHAIDAQLRQVDANLCLSSYTIEQFSIEKTPPPGHENVLDIFGCDICQRVCPWNEKISLEEINRTDKIASNLYSFFYEKKPEVVVEEISSLSKREFRKIFKDTPLARTGRDSLVKNVKDKT
jgi:epoxyqueuosine reductase